MRVLVMKAGKPSPLPLRTAVLILWGVTLGLGLAVLGASRPGAEPSLVAATTFWEWVFGASACVKLVVLSMRPRGGAHAVLKMGCGGIGLMASSQWAWLLLDQAGPTGCLGLVAVVALMDLRDIYKAAHDARSHHA